MENCLPSFQLHRQNMYRGALLCYNIDCVSLYIYVNICDNMPRMQAHLNSLDIHGHPLVMGLSPWRVKRMTQCQFISILQSLFFYLVLYLQMLSPPLGPWIYCAVTYACHVPPPLCIHLCASMLQCLPVISHQDSYVY